MPLLCRPASSFGWSSLQPVFLLLSWTAFSSTPLGLFARVELSCLLHIWTAFSLTPLGFFARVGSSCLSIFWKPSLTPLGLFARWGSSGFIVTMTERTGGMTRWRSLEKDGLDQLGIELLGSAHKTKRLIQYEAAGADPGTFQGQAFMAPGGEGSATKGGVWLPGAHVSASDKNLDAWMDNLDGNDSGMLLFHFCAKMACRAKSADHDVASHITHFRLMPPLMALKIPWAKAGVQAYLDEVDATELGQYSPTSPATSGAGSEVENAAANAVMPKGKQPAVVPKGNVNSANAAWSAALGLQGNSQQLITDKDKASQELALKLAGVDQQVQKDSMAGGIKPGPGLSTVTLELLAKGRLGTQLTAPSGAAVFAKAALPGVPVLDGPPPGAGHAEVVDPPVGAADKPSIGGRVPLGQQFGAQLALNAQKTSLKRASSAGPGGGSGLPKRSKFITELVSSLGGSMPGGHDVGDEMDPLGQDGDPSSSLGHGSFEMGHGGTSGSVVSTPILAQNSPGRILSETVKSIRQQISVVHGQDATEGPARRIMMFYYEVLFRPNLEGSLSHGSEREMRTFAAALDHLLDGDLAACGDVLISRFKALEEATTSGTWDIAANLEAVPPRQLSTITESERARATVLQVRRVRLRQSLQSLRQSSGPAGG